MPTAQIANTDDQKLEAPTKNPATRAEIGQLAVDWYQCNARDLPWRQPETSPWAVLVSEVMLQQTPVTRVAPVFLSWMKRWPTPVDLAADSPGDAVREWGKLGYPRRALRLHQCAQELVASHDGIVPSEVEVLLTLPGIGAYTARAVAAFAFGKRTPVVDTNVRRLVARAVRGQGDAGLPSTTRDLAEVDALLPADDTTAARLSIALMEIGALICTARSPKCTQCPLRTVCQWQAAGCPAYDGPTRTPQQFAGTDRQVRGLLLDVLRGTSEPVHRADLDVVWVDAIQRDRALDALITDGLINPLPDGRYALPGK